MQLQIKISQGCDVSSANRSTPGLLPPPKAPGSNQNGSVCFPTHLPSPNCASHLLSLGAGEPRALCCVAMARPLSMELPTPVQTLQSGHPGKNWTYCAPPAPGSCRIYGFLWHSTPTRCFPECSRPPSPLAAPGCCCKGPGSGRGRGSSPMAQGDW